MKKFKYLKDEFLNDPSLVLYLPLWKKDGASFMSDDAYGHLCTRTGVTHSPIHGDSFDGIDDGILVPHHVSLNPTSALTIIALINSNGWDRAYNTIVSKQAIGAGFEIEVLSTGKLEMLVSGAVEAAYYSGTGVHTLSTGTWYKVAMVWNRPNLKGYVNAVSDEGGDHLVNDEDINPTTNNLGIGYAPNFAARQLDGIIKELLIFNRALTPIEIYEDW